MNSEQPQEAPGYTITKKDHIGSMEKRGRIISVTSTSFEPSTVSIYDGESLTFQLHSDAEPLINNRIEQVYQSGKSLYTVVGGFHSEDNKLRDTQMWTQEFNAPNEYMFSFSTHKPLKVIVKPKPVKDMLVDDHGFTKPTVCVYKGDTVRWMWSECAIPHTIMQVTYCLTHAGYVEVEASNNPTKTGSHVQSFADPGVYYFMTDKIGDKGEGIRDTCVVQVLDKRQEHLVELKDNYSRASLEMKSGERVWVQWRSVSKHSTVNKNVIPAKRSIAIRKICQAKKNVINSEPDVVVEDTNNATFSGILSHVFKDVGVFEIFDKEHPAVRCVVLVKPTKQQHVIRITKSEFLPGNLTVFCNSTNLSTIAVVGILC